MKVLVVVLAAVVVAACGSDAAPVRPSPPPVATFTLTGRVVHAPTGTPTVGATVSVTTGVNAGRSTQSDLEGRFTLANLQPGTFPIEVAFGVLGTVLRRDVQLTQDTTLELVWTPAPPPTFALSGRITEAGAGAALGGATLAVIDGVNTGRTTTTAADGTYRMPDMTLGGFTLRIRYPSYDSEFRAVRLTADTTLDVQMRPAMQSLAGTWTGTFVQSTNAPALSIPEITLTQSGATVAPVVNSYVDFSGTIRDLSAIGSTTQITGTLSFAIVQGPPRAPTSCRGTGSFAGTVNWTRIVLTAPQVTFPSCSPPFTNATLVLIRQQ